tara:strand:+ start:1377 stop:1535 length:159 start_codon:yes stop_codon:yes gene_type:complete
VNIQRSQLPVFALLYFTGLAKVQTGCLKWLNAFYKKVLGASQSVFRIDDTAR